MKKRKLLFIPALLSAMAVLGGCYTLHFHDQSSPWQHDETSHWQVCSKCGKEFNKDQHSFDYENNCRTCAYHDPICIVNEDKVMTRLTEYGKNYTGELKKEEIGTNGKYINDFHKVEYIADNAFKDCKTSKFIIPNNVVGISENAFATMSADRITTQEEEELGPEAKPEWIPYNGTFYKIDIFGACEALVNGQRYLYLKDAIESITDDDVTVTILKKGELNVTSEGVINVTHRITLDSFYGDTTLKANLDIHSNGSVKVLQTVKLKGKTNLILADTVEKCGGGDVNCYNCGSLIFHKLTEKPEGISVHYIKPGATEETFNPPAVGSHQTYLDALIFEVDCYAYGTFKFYIDTNEICYITGLTEFGKTVYRLNITTIFDIENYNNTTIHYGAFQRHGTESLEISILGRTHKITVTGQFQKGKFHHVTIDRLVENINGEAFSTTFEEGHMDPTIREAVSLIMCPLETLTFGDNIQTIGADAFKGCCSLVSVKGGSGLRMVMGHAFQDCYKLKTVDFSAAKNFDQIFAGAFKGCSSLNYVNMVNHGWVTEKHHGFPENEMSPEQAAYKLVTSFNDIYWQRHLESNDDCYYYDPDDKDNQGNHNHAHFIDSLATYLNPESEVKDGSYVHLSNRCTGGKLNYDNLTVPSGHSAYIECDADEPLTIKNLIIDKGAYAVLGENVKVTNNVTLKWDNSDSKGITGGVAFFNTTNIPSVKFSSNTNIDAKPSDGAININGARRVVKAFGVANFNFDNTETLHGLSNLGKQLEEIRLDSQFWDDGREVIIGNYFSNSNWKLKKLEIGKKVSTICSKDADNNKDAFAHCENLTDVYFEDNSELKLIGRGTFFQCPNLENIEIDKCTQLETVGSHVFYGTSKLKEIKFNSPNLNYFGAYAFKDSAIESLDIGPNKVGWKANNITISDRSLINLNKAAELFKGDHSTHVWTRS